MNMFEKALRAQGFRTCQVKDEKTKEITMSEVEAKKIVDDHNPNVTPSFRGIGILAQAEGFLKGISAERKRAEGLVESSKELIRIVAKDLYFDGEKAILASRKLNDELSQYEAGGKDRTATKEEITEAVTEGVKQYGWKYSHQMNMTDGAGGTNTQRKIGHRKELPSGMLWLIPPILN